MYKRWECNKGITLVSLGVVIMVLLIVSTTMILSVSDRYKSEKLDKLASDLQLLTEKTGMYYLENKQYPIKDGAEAVTVNGATVYELDLTKMDGLTLNYGSRTDEDDYYAIDIFTGTVYYKKGIDSIYNILQEEKIEGLDLVKITTQPQWQSVKDGKTATFSVSVDCVNVDSVTYQWYVSETYEREGTKKIEGATTNTLTVEKASDDDSKYYYCVVGYYDFEKISEVAKLTIEPKWIQEGTSITDGSVTLKVGDYIEYEPQTEETTYEISSVYSGYTTTSSETYNKDTLNWRVLGVNERGKLELISDDVTSQNIIFYGYQGYNNAVYLINDMCNALYGNEESGTVGRGLAIKDIQNVMNLSVWDYHSWGKYGETISASGELYPTILSLEKGQKVGGREGNKYGESEQEELIEKEDGKSTNDIEIKITYWEKSLSSTNFINEIYYNLFINNGISNYSTYWLASRYLYSSSSQPCYGLRYVDDYAGTVMGQRFEGGDMSSNGKAIPVRPVVSLGGSIDIDTTIGDGTSAATAYGTK